MLAVIVIGLSLFVAVFTLQNPQPVSVRILSSGPFQSPLIVIILVSALAGSLTTYLVGLPKKLRKKAELSTHQQAIREYRQNLADKEQRISELERTALDPQASLRSRN